jgi:hypothetical protein
LWKGRNDQGWYLLILTDFFDWGRIGGHRRPKKPGLVEYDKFLRIFNDTREKDA